MDILEKLDIYLTEDFADDKNFTSDIQMLRAAMKAELDAINFYEQLAKKATSKSVKILFLDVASEEKVHMEEFERLTNMLDVEMEKIEMQAKKEVDALLKIKSGNSME